jgi:hypothetical protein
MPVPWQLVYREEPNLAPSDLVELVVAYEKQQGQQHRKLLQDG